MRVSSWRSACLGFGLVVVGTLAGCTKSEEKTGKPIDKSADASSAPAATTKSTVKASENDCVGPIEKARSSKVVQFGDLKFTLDGYLLTQVNKDPDTEITLGILSDTKEASNDNRKNIKKILEFFAKEKVDVIIHLGDIASILPIPEDPEVPAKDEDGLAIKSEEDKRRYARRMVAKARQEASKKSYEGLVEVLTLLAESEKPVFVVNGNRECKTTFNSALATVARDFPNVFNMNFIRHAALDDLDLISMPGYFDPEFVHCPWDPCLYFESDTLALADLARESKNTVMLVSHGPPRQKDRNGIDAVSEGENVGNPWLTSAIEKAGISFGAFGNIQEAGGKATNLIGNSIVAQDTFVSSLYLNPGPSDSMNWNMNDGTVSHGMAAVVHFVDKKASYKVFRASAEKASGK